MYFLCQTFNEENERSEDNLGGFLSQLKFLSIHQLDSVLAEKENNLLKSSSDLYIHRYY